MSTLLGACWGPPSVRDTAQEIRNCSPMSCFMHFFLLYSHCKFCSWDKNEMKNTTLDPPGELKGIEESMLLRRGSCF